MVKGKADFLSALESNISILIKIARVYAYTTHDRKDLINDIILELWKSYPKFKGDSKISTWIYRVSLNVALRAVTLLLIMAVMAASIFINLKYVLPTQFKRLNKEMEEIRRMEEE